MNIYSIYRRFQPGFRRKRWKHFLDLFAPTAETRVIDVGGHLDEWRADVPVPLQVTFLNLSPWPESEQVPERFRFVKGDARNLPFADQSFDLTYSNSVIEHVGDFQAQRRFADEARRVGRGVYVQTPNRWFPIEPHFIGFLVHWLPKRLRDRLMPWCSLRGWFRRGDDIEMKTILEEVRLLTYAEMQQLFPDCQIQREKFCGLTKSLIAVRKP